MIAEAQRIPTVDFRIAHLPREERETIEREFKRDADRAMWDKREREARKRDRRDHQAWKDACDALKVEALMRGDDPRTVELPAPPDCNALSHTRRWRSFCEKRW
jgi:hypothetical protein